MNYKQESGFLIHETEKAYLIEDKIGEFWIPKKHINIIRQDVKAITYTYADWFKKNYLELATHKTCKNCGVTYSLENFTKGSRVWCNSCTIAHTYKCELGKFKNIVKSLVTFRIITEGVSKQFIKKFKVV
jgi:hypothetical protein